MTRRLTMLCLLFCASTACAWSVFLPVYENVMYGAWGEYGIISYNGSFYYLKLGKSTIPFYDSMMTLPQMLVATLGIALAGTGVYLIRMLWKAYFCKTPVAHSSGSYQVCALRVAKVAGWACLGLSAFVLLDILAGTAFRWHQRHLDPSIHIQVTETGQYSFDTTRIDPQLLESVLREAKGTGATNHPIYFHVLGESSVTNLAPMIEVCRSMGYYQIRLQFEHHP